MAPTAKHPYTLDQLLKAIQMVKQGKLSLLGASRVFKIPYGTLGDKIRGRRPIKPRSRKLLTEKEEECLVHWIKQCAQRGFGKSRSDIKEAVKTIIESRGDSSTAVISLPSKQWLKDFFLRHKELSDQTPSSLGKEQALVSKQSLSIWFTEMKTILDQQDCTLLLSPERLYNVDETEFSFCPKSKVIALKGTKHSYNVGSNTKQNITVMACCSATGHYLPPLIIYPCKRIPDQNLLKGFESAFFQISPNGWINTTIFLSWLRDCFIPAVAEKKKPIALFVDGHGSHSSSTEISDLCSENGIILYCLKSHASHLIQPLDQTVFGAMKSAWEEEAKKQVLCTGKSVSIMSFASILKPVWEATTTPENAFNGFSKSGIFPFNPERVLTSEKLLPNLSFQDTACSTSAPDEIVIKSEDSTVGASSTSSTNQTDANNATVIANVCNSTSDDALSPKHENIKKLLQFTSAVGSEKFENLWLGYFDKEKQSSDPQLSKFKQLLDEVIKPTSQAQQQQQQQQQQQDAQTPSTSTRTNKTLNQTLSLPQVPRAKSSKKLIQRKSMPMVISGDVFKSSCLSPKEREEIELAKEIRKKERKENKRKKLKEEEERKKAAEKKRQIKKEESEAKQKQKADEALLKRLMNEQKKRNKEDESDSDIGSDVMMV